MKYILKIESEGFLEGLAVKMKQSILPSRFLVSNDQKMDLPKYVDLSDPFVMMYAFGVY